MHSEYWGGGEGRKKEKENLNGDGGSWQLSHMPRAILAGTYTYTFLTLETLLVPW